MLTGHNKYSFKAFQKKYIKKRKNSADKAKEILEEENKQREEQNMQMYDEFIPWNEASMMELYVREVQGRDRESKTQYKKAVADPRPGD